MRDGMPADAGTAEIADTPGTTSNGEPGGREGERLLAAAPEHERVAALQPHRLEALPPQIDEQLVQLLLPELGARDHERVLGRLGDELRRDEHVVHERVARTHEVEPARGDQPGVARACADQETVTKGAP